MTPLLEALTEAEHSAGFAVESLVSANRQADPVAHLLLLDLGERASLLRQDVAALASAVREREQGE